MNKAHVNIPCAFVFSRSEEAEDSEASKPKRRSLASNQETWFRRDPKSADEGSKNLELTNSYLGLTRF